MVLIRGLSYYSDMYSARQITDTFKGLWAIEMGYEDIFWNCVYPRFNIHFFLGVARDLPVLRYQASPSLLLEGWQ